MNKIVNNFGTIAIGGFTALGMGGASIDAINSIKANAPKIKEVVGTLGYDAILYGTTSIDLLTACYLTYVAIKATSRYFSEKYN